MKVQKKELDTLLTLETGTLVDSKKFSVKEKKVYSSQRLAGGFGLLAAQQSPEELLRRVVLANLLWEDTFYEDGIAISHAITTLIPRVEPTIVAHIAIEARQKQKLRHVPLFIAREMARLKSHSHLVGELLPQIIMRADELSKFLEIYWQDGKQPLSQQVKRGLATAFLKFDAYQLAKYNKKGAITLRDIMFLVHPKPTPEKEVLFKELANKELATPDTWEVSLSGGADKKETWTRLITEKKLGALAFVRNLRNMVDVRVDSSIIRQGFKSINPSWLLPLNYLSAARYAPLYKAELESLMLKGLALAPKLPGRTILIVDVSGSMQASISKRSIFNRMEAAAAMTVLASEMCEDIAIYATAGDDWKRIHKTRAIKPCRGFTLSDRILSVQSELGGGGIFTRQCLEYIKKEEQQTPERIIIFSDSQDCDFADKRVPAPFGTYNYIVDVSAHRRGINYQGVWSAEVSGWSEHFLTFIAGLEGISITE